MRLVSRHVSPSPRSADFARLSAVIEVESSASALDYWIDFPADLTADLSDNGNAWAILLLPLACYFREPLNLSLPVDRVLLDNLKGLQQIWCAWYPELAQIPIHVNGFLNSDQSEKPKSDARTISCFSGGIDSFFTLLRHDTAPLGDGQSTITDLLCVAGFNSAMDDFNQMQADLRPAAESFGRRLVPILTNIRYGEQSIQTPYSIERYMIGYAHMAILAGIVHLFGDRYKEFMIPASHHYANLMPYGSHPLTDKLLSASKLSVVHDGASFTRIERTELIAKSDEALKVLHVCWQDFADGNCSKCQKCIRTMAALDMLGARPRALSFDWSAYSLHSISRMWLQSPSDRIHYVDIAQAAEHYKRPDIAKAAYEAVATSARKYKILKAIEGFPPSRILWRKTRSLRNAVRQWRTNMRKISAAA